MLNVPQSMRRILYSRRYDLFLGYRTVCAILPQKLLFNYDIPGIQLSALKLAKEIEGSATCSHIKNKYLLTKMDMVHIIDN